MIAGEKHMNIALAGLYLFKRSLLLASVSCLILGLSAGCRTGAQTSLLGQVISSFSPVAHTVKQARVISAVGDVTQKIGEIQQDKESLRNEPVSDVSEQDTTKEVLYDGPMYGAEGQETGDSYRGQTENGRPSGQGTYTWSDGRKYDGKYEDGKREGYGTFTWPSGEVYVGEWRNDRRDGQGVFTLPNGGAYVGAWKQDTYDGQGTDTLPDGRKYVGEWKKGKREGQGTFTWPNGQVYAGEWKEGKYEGQGVLTYADGGKYTGQFRRGMFDGQGSRTWPDGTTYIGEWKDDNIVDSPSARAQLEKALTLNNNLAYAHYVLGRLCFSSGEHKKAQAHFCKCLELKDDHHRIHQHLAGALSRLGQYAESAEVLRQESEDKDWEPRRHIELAYVLLRGKHYKEVGSAIPANEGGSLGALLRFLACVGQGETIDPAIEALEQTNDNVASESWAPLVELAYVFGDPDAPSFLLAQIQQVKTAGYSSQMLELIAVRVMMYLGRYSEAEQVLRSSTVKPESEHLRQYYLAEIYDHLDRILEVESHLKVYISSRPDDLNALNKLGYLYAKNNMKLDEAEAMLKRAVEKEPQNGHFLDSLGWVYYRKGNADLAIEYLQRALSAYESRDIRDHLGDAYLLKGEMQNAVAEWRRALDLDPKFKGAQDKIAKYQG